jgi:hypothetical protein
MPREPKATVRFVDQYCAYYRAVLPEVRSFEQFTALHLGMMAELPRKTLPAIARAVGGDDAQSLHHFLTRAQAPFSQHTWWDQGKGWKNLLNNLRLIIQPAVFYCLLSPWLGVFALPSLQQGFQSLIAMMNNFQGFVPV